MPLNNIIASADCLTAASIYPFANMKKMSPYHNEQSPQKKKIVE